MVDSNHARLTGRSFDPPGVPKGTPGFSFGIDMDEFIVTRTHNFTTEWSEEDQEFVGTCLEYPSLSHLDKDQEEALNGIMRLVELIELEL